MILSVSDIKKSYADVPVLEQVSFHLEDQEKAAVVGINGAGKSTLLKIIAGELDPDEGSVTLAKDKTIGYLSQHQEAFGGRTVYEEVLEGKRDLVEMEQTIHAMEAEMQMLPPEKTEAFLDKYHRLLDEFKARDGYSYASEVNGILRGLGFAEEEFGVLCDTLSGGQKTRVALARLLVSHPDLILLDEPTNHLDIAAIGWLETFLINYKGAVLVVAHDRYFLDRIVTKVVEIRDHRAAVYKGNYSYYASRAEMRITLAPSITSGKDVLHVEGLKKTYGDQLLFQDLSLDIRRGEHVALIGENGTGKTTLLKILNQVIDADDGLFRLGMNVVIGYYDQELQDLHPKMTLFDEIAEERPDLTQTQIRNLLAAFLFRGDEVFLSVGDLSGGERGRLSLAKLMLSESNFLLLDEPTNHLDTESREILESALNQYEGTVLFVSHDRYFINKTASRILEFNNGKLTEYLGNYDYYLEKKAEQGNVPGYSEYGGGQSTVIKTAAYCSRDVTTGEGADSSGRAEWVAQKEEQARIKKLQNRIERTEQEITALEEHLDQIDKEFQKPEVATNPSLLSELHEERSEISAQLEELYAEWETLADASKSP